MSKIMKSGFQAGHTLLICSYFSQLLLKNALLFYSKILLTRKNPDFFTSPAEILSINYYVYSGSMPLNISKFYF